MAEALRSCAPPPEWLENVPVDDEPVTEAEIRAVQEAERDIARGEVYSTEEVLRMLDL